MHTAPGSRSPLLRWLPLIASLLWVAGAVALVLAGRSLGWSPGVLVIAGSGWLLVLLVAARQAVRNLFGPVFLYETVRVGRRPSTFVLRWVYIAVLVSLLALLYFAWAYRFERSAAGGKVPPKLLAQFASTFFEVLAVVQFAVIVLLTPGYVAGTISNEKERKTLEFLLATDLKNREIVFGKLAARALTLGMYVLAGLPLLAFLQLFGGIDPDLALAAAAGTVVTVFGLSAVALAFSAMMSKSRDAIAVCYLTVIGYLAVSFTLAVLAHEFLQGRPGGTTDLGVFKIDWTEAAEWFASGNAVWVFEIETRGGRSIDGDAIASMVGRYVAFWGVATVLCLGYAVLRLRAVALKQSYGEPRTASAKRSAGRPDIGTDPVMWKEVFVGGRRMGGTGILFRLVVIGLVAVVPAIGVYTCFIDPDRRWNPTFAGRWNDFVRGISVWLRVCTGVLSVIVMFGVALRGAATVAGERDKDTWISLLSAPLTAMELLRGKWLGCVLSMRFAYWVLLGVWAFGLAVQAVMPLMLLLAALLLFVYASAFSWVGILCSLSAKTTLGASIRAFALSAFLVGGFWLLFLVCCALPISLSGSGGDRMLEIPAQLLLGGTPPFMAGWAPMREFDRDGMGPFHPDERHGVGPAAAVIGVTVWIGLNLAFAALAYRMMVVETNRHEKTRPTDRDDRRPPPRMKAKRAEE